MVLVRLPVNSGLLVKFGGSQKLLVGFPLCGGCSPNPLLFKGVVQGSIKRNKYTHMGVYKMEGHAMIGWWGDNMSIHITTY